MLVLKPWILCFVVAFIPCSLTQAQDSNSSKADRANQQVLAEFVKSIQSQARSVHERIKRADNDEVRDKAATVGTVTMRDSLRKQFVQFEGKSLGTRGVDNEWELLEIEMPSALVPYSRNDNAFSSGGLFSHPVRMYVPKAEASKFPRGQVVSVIAGIDACFSNDAPVKKVGDSRVILIDVCIPLFPRDGTVTRIEVAMEEIVLKCGDHSLELAKPSKAPITKEEPRKPQLELALLEIERRVTELITEARRQKNTALITEVLAKSHRELREWLDGQEWEYDSQVVDVRKGDNTYLLSARPTKALAKFSINTREGIHPSSVRVAIDEATAKEIGRGDFIRIKGTTSTSEVNRILELQGIQLGGAKGSSKSYPDYSDIQTGESLPVFSIVLPPLDGEQPLRVEVSLTNVLLAKLQTK